MSFLNITISYVNTIEPSRLLDLSFKKRKIYFITALLAFFFFALVYIYLTGLVVSRTFEHERLNSVLSRLTNETNKTESALSSQEAVVGLSFYLNSGFEEPKTLDTIRRNKNVAQTFSEISY